MEAKRKILAAGNHPGVPLSQFPDCPQQRKGQFMAVLQPAQDERTAGKSAPKEYSILAAGKYVAPCCPNSQTAQQEILNF